MSEPRVVESSVRSFVCVYERYEEAPFRLGTLVAVREGSATVLGVVADIESGPEDPTRPLQPRGNPGQSASDVMADNPELRLLLRTAITIVSCGFVEDGAVRAALPPNPPPLLALVGEASIAEALQIGAEGAFLALLVHSPLCDDPVIAAAIRSVGSAYGAETEAFNVIAGKELARLLRADPSRLTNILRGVAG